MISSGHVCLGIRPLEGGTGGVGLGGLPACPCQLLRYAMGWVHTCQLFLLPGYIIIFLKKRQSIRKRLIRMMGTSHPTKLMGTSGNQEIPVTINDSYGEP